MLRRARRGAAKQRASRLVIWYDLGTGWCSKTPVCVRSCYKETVVRKGWFSHAARHQEPASLTQRDDPSRRETIPPNIHTHTHRWRKGTVVGQRMRTANAPPKGLAVWLHCRVHKCIEHVHIACDRQAYACWDFPIPPFSPPSSAARKSAAPAHMRRWFDNVPPPYHPVNNDSYTRHLNTALRAVTRSLVIKRQL